LTELVFVKSLMRSYSQSAAAGTIWTENYSQLP